jgi:hypothetical protein
MSFAAAIFAARAAVMIKTGCLTLRTTMAITFQASASWRAPRRSRLRRAVHPMAVGQDVPRNLPVVVFSTKGNFATFVDKADIAVQ